MADKWMGWDGMGWDGVGWGGEQFLKNSVKNSTMTCFPNTKDNTKTQLTLCLMHKQNIVILV